MYWFFYILLWLPIRILFPTRVIGKKNIKKEENYLFISNHRSNVDVFLLGAYLPKRKYFLAKKELMNTSCKKKFFGSIGVISIDRNSIDLTAVKRSIEVLKNGKSLMIFPEGTRKDADEVDEIKNGASMFSIKTGVRIVPVFIRKKARVFRWNKIYVGEPFDLNEFSGQKLTKEVLGQASEILTEKINNNHDEKGKEENVK